jgi:hypothetical protein
MVDELTTIFVQKGMMDPETSLWASTPVTVTESVASAMWNYKFVVGDQSMGVHNSTYTKALLEQALDAMK